MELKRINFILSSLISWLSRLGMLGLLLTAWSCSPNNSGETQPKSRPGSSQVSQEQQIPSVDIAIPNKQQLNNQEEYTGTTLPQREIAVRSQVEGQILDITVDVGEPVQSGQVVASIDDELLFSEVVEAEAELAALQADEESLAAEVNNAQVAVERSRLELEQARSDAARSEQLYRAGAIPEQNLELAQTAVGTATQTWRAAQQQVQNRISAVNAAQRRVTAQQAIVNRAKQQQAYTNLIASVDGSVLNRVLEPGDLAQPGAEILRLGDLSQIKIQVQISELELNKIKLGQTATVRLDAFVDRTFVGRVSQISPVADPTARLIPIEVTIPNSDRRIGSGLLARVNFTPPTTQQLVIPETAIEISASSASRLDIEQQQATIFVVTSTEEQATVKARRVTIGKTKDHQVEVLSGLKPQEQFVIRSSQELKDGDRVRLSFISET